ncbi:G-type lectin S-receptor-like serine/threonine-protein kinase At1g11410 [Impatiens glandulifera]|uniref:G-type lectin S-receptor-like serine/threonine-protein kinase At1g11410 n=1 Tax=Impatiens glandulifera TaxID=253017 RepID=UPI001FB0819A|nr:G-type lectin S-receptor-like serine/threonine-protein kinase At1g11410 [Impatiens glandulifera]
MMRRIFTIFTVFFLLFFFFFFCCCNSIDTITFDNPLKDDDRNHLVSTAGTFVLGFFSPGKSTNRYIGIWYNFSTETIVWVANRDNPVRDSSGVLSLDQTGNLVITASNLSTPPVWSTTNFTTSPNLVSAQLSDSGNLRLLRDNAVVWQSIDHPTNTIIPSMKLGLDRRANRYTVITSWKSPDDPGTGEYTYRMDLTEMPELVYEQGPTRRLWRTGPWIGNGWSGIPEVLINDFIFSVVYTNDRDEATLAYSNSSASIIPRLVANETGNLQRLAWQEGSRQWYESWSYQKEECNNYNHCGAYGNCDPQPTRSFECTCLPGFEPKSTIDWFTIKDGSGGCVRKQGRMICREGDGFVPVENAKLPDMRVARVNMSMGLEACKENCLKNCNCTAYASSTGGEVGCITWIGELLDTRVFPTGGHTLFVRVDNVELAEYLESQQRPRRSAQPKRVTYIIVASTIIPLAIIGALIVFWFITQKRRKDRKRNNRHMLFTTANGSSSSQENSTRETHIDDFPFFDLSTIVASTDNFSISNKLGEGGFGMVYKGRLRNGVEIAVKRLAKNSGQGTEEFKNEVCLIAKLQHRNLVRLLGSCVEHHEKMLIYEYLPNRSLDSFIFDEEKRSQLSWEKRFNIILGIARGVIYLHQDSRLRIIHRDLKASNILLDDELSPKISDFGMAKIFKGDQMEANTKRVVGTYGYMSPEYAMGGLYSTRSDVFSFGVILIEVVTGKKNSSYYRDDTINLIGHTWNLWKEDKALEIMDRSMGDSWPEEEVLRCVHIGLLCVQELVMDRPTMSDVAFMLCNEIALPFPKQPAFIFNGHDTNDSSTSDVKAKSNNGLTITQVEAR